MSISLGFAIVLLLVLVVFTRTSVSESFLISKEDEDLFKLLPAVYRRFKSSGTKGVAELIKDGLAISDTTANDNNVDPH